MKRFTKFLSIWLAGLVLITLLANTAGMLIAQHFLGGLLIPSMYGYSKKMTFPLEPAATEEERKKNGALMMVRALVSDTRLENLPGFFYNFLMLNVVIDESTVFFTKDGMHECSSGIFLTAAEETEETSMSAFLPHVIGLVDIRKLAAQDCAGALRDTLEEHPDAVAYLDAYAVKGSIVEPASISLRGADGSTLLTVECPCEGKPIQSDHVLLRESSTREGLLREPLKLAMMGERRSDQTAAKLAEGMTFGQGDVDDTKVSYGIASVTISHLEIMGDYACVSTYDFHYWRGVVFYMVLLGSVMTIAVVLLYMMKA